MGFDPTPFKALALHFSNMVNRGLPCRLGAATDSDIWDLTPHQPRKKQEKDLVKTEISSPCNHIIRAGMMETNKRKDWMVCCDVHIDVFQRFLFPLRMWQKKVQNMQRVSETKPEYLLGTWTHQPSICSKFGANITSGFGQTHLDCWDARGTQGVRPGPRKRSSCWSTAEHTAGYTSAGTSRGWPALWQEKVALSVKKKDVGHKRHVSNWS